MPAVTAHIVVIMPAVTVHIVVIMPAVTVHIVVIMPTVTVHIACIVPTATTLRLLCPLFIVPAAYHHCADNRLRSQWSLHLGPRNGRRIWKEAQCKSAWTN